jgi:hypothetical protein
MSRLPGTTLRLTITPTHSDLELRFNPPSRRLPGGFHQPRRLLVKTTFSVLEPAVEVQRRPEISLDYSNPALRRWRSRRAHALHGRSRTSISPGQRCHAT